MFKQLICYQAELWQRGGTNPVQSVNFSHAGAVPITLDVRHLLHLEAAAAIPHGHGAVLNIDLQYVRTMILD
jgi:hypothetical protein